MPPTPPYRLYAWLRRIDRFLGDVNAFLMVLAIGLGVLDFAVLVMFDLPITPLTVGTASAAGDPALDPLATTAPEP